ncbi:hypothetical protein VE03_10194 [Pseudogymnoascus sp. 23342-1-I1]|nr:hypothetical protein VE03_10194 [Pseudogymnoascus sp. 23342-1-I1]
MELDATFQQLGLSSSERERRFKDKLCFTCGKPGHRARDCRQGGKGSKSGRSKQLNATWHEQDTQKQLNASNIDSADWEVTDQESEELEQLCATASDRQLYAVARIDGRHLRVMIDSGATGNFMTAKLAATRGFQLQEKDQPQPLLVVDGTPISSNGGMITHATTPVEITMHGGHHTPLLLCQLGGRTTLSVSPASVSPSFNLVFP